MKIHVLRIEKPMEHTLKQKNLSSIKNKLETMLYQLYTDIHLSLLLLLVIAKKQDIILSFIPFNNVH